MRGRKGGREGGRKEGSKAVKQDTPHPKLGPTTKSPLG